MSVMSDPNLRDIPKISDKIRVKEAEGKPFFSFEYFPPKTPTGVDNLHARIDRMAKLEPLFCDITWGARGTTAGLTLDIAGNIQKYHGLDCMMHLTCTNMPSGMAKGALEEAKERGLHNILALRGDAAAGEKWKAAEGGFQHAVDLVKFIREEYGDYFGICVAGYPEGHPDGFLSGNLTFEEEMSFLKEKIDCGADLIITQMFFDVDVFLSFVKRCREMGIKVPILPGILPLMNFSGFQRMTGLCKTAIPPAFREALDKVKDDDDEVKKLGIRYGIEMCQKILKSGLSPGLHFYSLNLESSVVAIIDGLGFITHTEAIRSLPWRPSTMDKRRTEKVRPVYWANRFKSYLYRTSDWNAYPQMQWTNGDCRSFNCPPKGNLIRDEEISAEAKEKLLEAIGTVSSEADVRTVFVKIFSNEIRLMPWSEMEGLSPETALIAPQLIWMNKQGFFTINSQPRVTGAHSSDPVVGWGGKGGVVYQKPYVEFFAPPETIEPLMEVVKKYPSVTITAISADGKDVKTSAVDNRPNAITWGVFPNSEVMQPSILELESFKAWSTEAFGVWTNIWGALYEPKSESRQVINDISSTYYLVSLVDNDFVQGDVFRVIADLVQ